ncbi:PhzF family phenazine biosynthesis protein [Marinigracilibium pacificum]|uniref:PhzF family phenazine biosynthesis protein n=1 Tax=Marinigracilibium pacificum TaxID=2729599 RepID=A0A848J8T5_9BACT|nr:PhzF family phenazine biosynthesis isomerase [Marinigracilibium pacificum]NMM50844.1 PhzF family phenazine biosynthesis protein [Marinigracilibium pacificum]
MKTIKTFIVDSFTDRPFKGNPAGVCLLNENLSNNDMLSIAQELGLSETAFVSQPDDENHFPIRFFSPKMEIPLCGHATLAASKVIFNTTDNEDSISFINLNNLILPIRMDGEFIIMEFPIYDTKPQKVSKELLNALGINEIINSEYNKETNILLIEIGSSKNLQALSPDFDKLLKSHNSINGVLVTAKSEQPSIDFESRYFWPWSGTNEDPVTGGTHTFLAKYWSERLDKKKLNSFQCSERTGFMEVELINELKMTIKSKAQIVFKGELTI